MPAGWAKTRARILARDPACRIGGPGCLGASSEVDHIRPGLEAAWNLRGVCSVCHRAKTAEEAKRARLRR